MKNLNAIYLLIVLMFMAGCKENTSRKVNKRTDALNRESMLEANSVLVERDRELIESYVERRGWAMDISTTGLWYMIYHETTGIRATQGMRATIDYRVELLDGTLCYDSREHPKTFKIGQGGVESGLEQGILMMREGEKAKLIMPPYLAHGLLGDENKIPPRSIIVYDVHLTELQ